jgi:Inner membrane protein CreD
MPELQPPPPLPRTPSFLKRSSSILKLVAVGALILVMLIPLAMITAVLNERLQRRNDAVNDITASWAREQNVIGPVLGIYKFKSMKDTTMPDGQVEWYWHSFLGRGVRTLMIGAAWPAFTLFSTLRSASRVTHCSWARSRYFCCSPSSCIVTRKVDWFARDIG